MADIKAKEFDSMLQCHFVDGCFDPALQQFLWMHARNDDFEATVAKARQYMDAQEQAKMAAVCKKPNVRFAMSEPEPNQIQLILDGLQKVLQTVLDNQNQRPEVKIGETSTPNSGGSKKKNSKPPSSATSNGSNSTQGSDRRQNQGYDSSVREREQYQDFGQSRNWSSNSAESQFWEPLRDQRPGAQASRRDGSPVQNDTPPPRLADFRPRGQENRPPWREGCYVCGERNCHSMLHRGNPDQARLPLESRAPLPRRTLEELRAQFRPWQNYQGCNTCGRQDCYSTFHLDPPRNVPFSPRGQQRPPPQNNVFRGPAAAEDQSNGQRGPRQGDRPPQDDSNPSPQSQ